jgi:hypothetical protein
MSRVDYGDLQVESGTVSGTMQPQKDDKYFFKDDWVSKYSGKMLRNTSWEEKSIVQVEKTLDFEVRICHDIEGQSRHHFEFRTR